MRRCIPLRLPSQPLRLPPHLDTTPIPKHEARDKALSLYRNCVRSARRIPTHEQREIWMTYLRSKFRENSEITDPVRWRRAFRDGHDQLSRMNYFHEVREKKAQQQQQQQQQQADASVGADRTASPVMAVTHGQPSGGKEESCGVAKMAVVRYFLEEAIPGISEEDAGGYAKQLVEDGFDTPAMLTLLVEDDLQGFKKAHRRAVMMEVEARKKKQQ